MKFDQNQNINNVNIEKIIEILSIPPIYANRYYFAVEDNMVRITFADENLASSTVKIRQSVIMSINGFMAFMSMLAPQAEKIKSLFEERMQNQKGQEEKSDPQ